MSDTYFDPHGQSDEYVQPVPSSDQARIPQHLDEGYDGLAQGYDKLRAIGERAAAGLLYDQAVTAKDDRTGHEELEIS